MSVPSPCVCVVDDELSVRKSIARLLRAHGLDVQAYASTQEYLEAHDPATPGCLVLDLALPGHSGLELQAALVARAYSPPIIFLSGRAEIADSVRAMKLGAIEFLTKPVDEQALLPAVRAGVDKDRAERSRHQELSAIRARLNTLTRRENEVLHRVIAGRLNKQTAAELGTAEKTIKVHRARIMEKLGANSLAELVRLVNRVGLEVDPGS